MTRIKGFIIRIPEGKQFGFIKGEDNMDYFFHESAFQGDFQEAARTYERDKIYVTFEGTKGQKGYRAENVVEVGE